MRTSSESRRALPLEGLKQGARGGTVVLSALTGEGTNDLLRLLDEQLAARTQVYVIELSLTEGAALAWLYEHGQVLERKDKKNKTALKITLDAADFGRFNNKFGNKIHAKV